MKIGVTLCLWVVFFALALRAEDSFLSNDEYAKMLYKNPRGIGCDNCHGEHGEGKVLASYTKNGTKKFITAPSITNLPMEVFKKALSKKSRLMPEYFLTDEEKAYLYYYLIKQNTISKANE